MIFEYTRNTRDMAGVATLPFNVHRERLPPIFSTLISTIGVTR